MSNVFSAYHRDLFQWHEKRFFPFSRHLNAVEMDYLETCFDLAETLEERSASGYSQYSYFSFSHRVRGGQVNSSRLAYGSLRYPEKARAAAEPVLKHRGVGRLPAEGVFYGLAWDLEAGHFKVYLLSDLEGVSGELLELGRIEDFPLRSEALLSFTYIDGQLIEQKVYRFPRETRETLRSLPPGSAGRALMRTDRRGVVAQYDVSDPGRWRERLSPVGHSIMDAYAEIGESLDTLAYQDRDNFTLYFPA